MQRYQHMVAHGEVVADKDQLAVIDVFQRLYGQLRQQQESAPAKTFSWPFIKRKSKKPGPVIKGIYLWGGVGRGKTFLMNLFFQWLPLERKVRLHFHRFMQLVHDELSVLGHRQDPLKIVAADFASEARVLCLDEMMVIDITDAMLMSRLLACLHEEGVVVIMTANVSPEDQYKDGLQRSRFIPAIQQIQQNHHVFQIGGELDYRARLIDKTGLYRTPADEFSEQWLEDYFQKLTNINLHEVRKDIVINLRRIPVRRWADDIVWFEFAVICGSARSTRDYAEIATYFHTVMISGIPVMDDQNRDWVRRFINLVDVFYDEGIRLIITAEAEPAGLYTSGSLLDEYQRTRSRLLEMQTREYLHNRMMS